MRKFLFAACTFALLLSSASAQDFTPEERQAGVQRQEYTRHLQSGAKRALGFHGWEREPGLLSGRGFRSSGDIKARARDS